MTTIPTLRLTIYLALLLLLCALPATAQEAPASDYPTLAALEAAIIPPADPVDLARRLRGVVDILPTPAAAQTRQVGEQQIFWVINEAENREFQVNAALRVVGQHIYMWLEEGAPVTDADLQALADAFDTHIYPGVRELWGSEATPGVDGDPRIYSLFAHGLGGGVAAYFTSRHTYPQAVTPTSNQHEMFFFNLDAIGTQNIDNPYVESVLAHEFQHMIRSNIQDNDDLWLNEGFSVFTQLHLYNDPGSILGFLAAPQTQFNAWTEDGARTPHYGAALAFLSYFYERYGLEALQRVSLDPGTGLDAFQHVLDEMGEPDVNHLFADWTLANYLRDPSLADGRYGYTTLPDNLPSPTPLGNATAYPFIANATSNHYASDYYVLTNLDGLSALDISITLPETVPLIPTAPASGEWMWYSNRGDVSDMTLTHTFDLTGVQTATLQYNVWYDIEDDWDYAYLMVSADGGATWDILPTAYTTDSNPHHLAYGPGYTGESGGWLAESISLDAHAGQVIQVRFEIISDDGVSQPGIAIDAVSIPEIGYSSDFEVDGGGWEAAGWIRTDNRLPGRAWVQVVQRVGDDVQVSRWLAPAETQWTLPIVADDRRVLVVVSPFAPETTVPVRYTLQVSIGE